MRRVPVTVRRRSAARTDTASSPRLRNQASGASTAPMRRPTVRSARRRYSSTSIISGTGLRCRIVGADDQPTDRPTDEPTERPAAEPSPRR